MSTRYIITVDQGAIRRDEPAIHIHDTYTDQRRNVSTAFLGEATIQHRTEGLMDGSRVWIETDVVR